MARFKGSRMNLITQNVDINLIKQKEKLDFGQQNGLRKDMRPLPNLSNEEIKKKEKIKALGER